MHSAATAELRVGCHISDRGMISFDSAARLAAINQEVKSLYVALASEHHRTGEDSPADLGVRNEEILSVNR